MLGGLKVLIFLKKITFAYQSCMETWNGNCCDLQMLIEWDDFQF